MKMQKGTLKKTEGEWVIYHKIIDPYSQIPNPIPLDHNELFNGQDDLFNGTEVEFEIKFKYYAKIVNDFKKCPYFCFINCTCKEGVCQNRALLNI